MASSSTSSILNKIIQAVLAFLATIIGLYPLFYIIEDNFGMLGNKASPLLASVTWNVAFYAHIMTGGLGLLTGWVQFNKRIRVATPVFHRNLGKLYIALAICSSFSAAYLAFHAEGGWIAATGFFTLALIWFTSTWQGYVSILESRFVDHQKWMVFSFAACFAAVTLRILLPILVLIFNDFIQAYMLVAWLCWVPNMLVAVVLTKNMKE